MTTPPPSAPTAPVVNGRPQSADAYHCGTLVYTKRGLMVLFCWLLWGEFCFNLMETIVPSIVPLKLQSLGSPNWIISLIMTTLPGIFNTTICPWVSFKSDAHRSRWGRRIPFIFFTIPFLTASLLLIGFSDSISHWVHHAFLSGSSVSQSTVVILLLALFAGMFDLFNMFVGSVYYYLYNDVVPESHQSRFMGWSRLVGVLTSTLYNFFIYRFALSHMREIYTGAALIYFIGFGLMCLKLKEGEYPPLPEKGPKSGLLDDIKTFFGECFGVNYYRYIFFGTMFASIGATVGVFNAFTMQSLGLSLDQIGKAAAIGGVGIAVCLTVAGVFADKWHPVRVDAYVTAFNFIFMAPALLWLFIDPPPSRIFFWITVCGSIFAAPMNAVYATAAMPRIMHLFPKERFGAFCGAQAMIRSAGTMAGGLGAGLFLDIVRRYFPEGSLSCYRFAIVWQMLFAGITFYCCYVVYRGWRRLGGDASYQPPVESFSWKKLPPATATRSPVGVRIPLLIAWSGVALTSAAYFYYYVAVSKDVRSAIFAGAFLALMLVLLGLLLRLLTYMERP